MARECKLCCLLGATLADLSDGNSKTHTKLHAHQLQLIGINRAKCVGKIWTISIKRQQTGHLDEKSEKFGLSKLSQKLVDIHGKRNSGIECAQCKYSIPSQPWKSTTASSLINHACIHLNKELFACRHCDLKFISMGGVYSHLRKIHALSGIRQNYIDLTNDHQSEIMDMLKHCFGNPPAEEVGKEETIGHVRRRLIKRGGRQAARMHRRHCPPSSMRGLIQNQRKNAPLLGDPTDDEAEIDQVRQQQSEQFGKALSTEVNVKLENN